MNNIMRMNMVMIKEKMRPLFQNDGFNYKDRKISKAGKSWIKDDKLSGIDVEAEDRKLFIKSQIRNGILAKDTVMLQQAVENAKKYPKIAEAIALDVAHAELVIAKIGERKKQVEAYR